MRTLFRSLAEPRPRAPRLARSLAIAFVCLFAANAHAEPWYRGEYGKNRILHISITAGALALHPLLDLVETPACTWCSGPNSVDRGVRDALLWTNTGAAAVASDVDAYVVAPAFGFTLVLAGTLDEPSVAAVIDDMIPICESLILTHWATTGLKLAFARERPYAHFTGTIDDDAFLSFPSGHTSRAFAAAASAGMVAHLRGYKSEPYIWVGGMALATLAAYFRIAADRHYFTDVLAGGAVGVSVGLTVPLLMRRRAVAVVATRTGFALAGHW